MHLCAAVCCEKTENSVDQVHRCIESCSTPLTQAQSFVQNELSQFQERLQRCVMTCQDRVRDQVTADTSEAQGWRLGALNLGKSLLVAPAAAVHRCLCIKRSSRGVPCSVWMIIYN
nr:protein FAM136A-like isoform X2 [Cherax quadricarinatus]